MSLELKSKYKNFLDENEDVKKIPYIETVDELTNKIPVYKRTDSVSDHGLSDHPYDETLRDINIKVNKKTKEKTIQVYQRGLTLKEFGRLRGNMEYLEDSWDIQIRPLVFLYAHLKELKPKKDDQPRITELKLTEANQMKLRDKYLKVRVRYDGTKYALVNAIRTFYTISYA